MNTKHPELNTITTNPQSSPFCADYLNIEVDGRALEEYVLETKVAEIPPGLVPTLLDWLSPLDGRAEVWKRVLPERGESSCLPILMCSEDLDLWCTLIMVEVQVDSSFVYWRRFGLENSTVQTPEEIGASILWFDDVPPLTFHKEEYMKVIETFRQR